MKELRRRIEKANIPSSCLDESINIATWNIREFGRRPRKRVSIHYIAEILNQFDLVAVTELRANLSDFARVLDILGPYWHVVYSDYVTDRGGNRERMAYLYDKRAVVFTGMASELDAPRKKDRKTGEYVPRFAWWRSPFVASFSAGSFDFVMIAAHIRWGSGASARVKPLELMAKAIDKRRRERHGIDKDIILLGDFNIPRVDDKLFQAITCKGLRIPEALRGAEHGSNLARNKRYDQILHYPSQTKCFTNNAGVLDFYTGGISKLYPGEDIDKRKFTYELSDHLPLWVQLDIDTEDEQLDQIIRRNR
ncbi:MAG: endonuclease/exonuclease/phosphatase family protein [Chloroflexota bacterium]|nr:endonuclease/exonuclease/phosphatase family protein [Chloroflexota bacterium]